LWTLFGVRPGSRAAVGAGLVLLAAMVALNPSSIDTDAPGRLAVAFVAPLTFGVAISVLTERLGPLPAMGRIAGASVGASLGLLPLLVTQDVGTIVPTSWWSGMLVVGIGVGTSLIPMTLYVVAAPVVGAARTAMSGAVELPTVFLIGWILLGESLGWEQLLAGGLIVLAIVVTPARSLPVATATSSTV